MAVAIPFIGDPVVLRTLQEQIIGDVNEKGVDASSCKGSIPQYGIGVLKCLGGSLRNYENEHGPVQPGPTADETFVPAE
jgi:hypothetical protein